MSTSSFLFVLIELFLIIIVKRGEGIEGDDRQTIGRYLHLKVHQLNGMRD